MPKIDTILAVDIGADSLKMAEFIYPPEGGMILEKFAFAEYGGDMKEDELLQSLFEVFKKAIIEHGFKAKKVHLSISGQSAFIRPFVKLPPVGEEEGRVKQIVEYEARQNVPFPISEVIWDYQLISAPNEEEEGSNEIEVMFVVVKNELIDKVTKIIEEVGKDVVLIEVAPTACFNSAKANEIGEKQCEMILNIGGRCSSLVFIDGGRFFVRTIPIAGHTITQQISKEFSIPFADAEEMKRRHGFVALGGAYEEPDSEVAATVSKIVRNVMTRLHGEINRSINVYRSQQKGRKPSKLYLAGGSSVMAFTPRFFSEKLRIPVEYLNPFQVVSLAKEINKEELAEVAHMFSEVIGLGLRHITVCPIEISLMPEKLKKQQELKQKTPYFYASAASLLICLLILLWGVTTQESIDERRLKIAKNEVAKVGQKRDAVGDAKQKLENTKLEYLDAADVLKNRNGWIILLDELQRNLPDRLWLTSIKGIASASESAGPNRDSGTRPRRSGIADIFDTPGRGPKSTALPKSQYGWLKLEGNCLLLPDDESLVEDFMANLVKSKMFTDNKDDIRINYYLIPRAGSKNNLSGFDMEVKLTEPIKK